MVIENAFFRMRFYIYEQAETKWIIDENSICSNFDASSFVLLLWCALNFIQNYEFSVVLEIYWIRLNKTAGYAGYWIGKSRDTNSIGAFGSGLFYIHKWKHIKVSSATRTYAFQFD